jgi:hypothetical protein
MPHPRPLGLPAHLTWPVPVDPRGVAGPTEGSARGKQWRRTSRGLYVPADVERSTRQRIAEAAAVLPAYGGVTGWAGLRWQGARWFDGARRGDIVPVTLAVADRSIRPQPAYGIAISEERMGPEELEVHRGLRITDAIRSVFFEMRYAETDTKAVQVADMVAYDDLVTPGELRAFVGVNAGWTGMDRARVGAEDMDENAWSPTEVSMRRTWEHGAKLPRPLCNRPVFDLNRRHLGTPDLIDPIAGVVGEYNSSLHLEGTQRTIDVGREARFRDVGLEFVEMITSDLSDPLPFIGRLRAAYARAARIPVAERRWTITPPPWWIPTFTVEQRRNLTDDQRERLLGYRRQAG